VTGDDLVIETEALTKRFRRRTALNECSLSVPRVGLPPRRSQRSRKNDVATTSRRSFETIGRTNLSLRQRDVNDECRTSRSRGNTRSRTVLYIRGGACAKFWSLVVASIPHGTREFATRHLSRLESILKAACATLGGQRGAGRACGVFRQATRAHIARRTCFRIGPCSRQDLLHDITELFADNESSVLMAPTPLMTWQPL